MDAPAKKLRTFSRKTPASAPEKRRALGTADENTSVPGKSSDWPAMDPATEIKQLRQLCFLLRAELAAQSSTVTSSFLAQLSACGAILALCLSLPCHGYTFCWVSSTVQIFFSALLSPSKVITIVSVAGLTTPCHAQEGTPGPATPAFGEDTELRIEAVVKERVGAELVDVMFKARQHGRQQVRHAFQQ